MGRRGVSMFSMLVGTLSGAAAGAGTYFLGLEGDTDLNDVSLLIGIGAVVALVVGIATYRIAREDEPEG